MWTIFRSELANPDAVAWEWKSWEVPPHRLKEQWVQLADGRWFQINEAKGDIIQGSIVPWESFKLMMRENRDRYAKIHQEFSGALFVAGICAVLLGTSLGLAFKVPQLRDYWGLLGLTGIIGLVFGIPAIQHVVMKSLELRSVPLYDPGPNPETMHPRDFVEDQSLRGAGFEDPAEAVFNMGAGSFNRDASLKGRGRGNRRHLG
jgi:hypothetical protein